MEIRVEIVEVVTREHRGKTAAGKEYEIRTQKAYLHNGKYYPAEFDLPTTKDAAGNWLQPYPPGFYDLTPESLQVNGEFKYLEINRYDMRLVKAEPLKPLKP